MSYSFYSFRKSADHSLTQWENRSVEHETRSCEKRTLATIFERFVPDSKSRILEAGCGLGGWVNYFLQRGHRVVGIECEEEIVSKVKEFDVSFPIMSGDILNLDFPDGSFDAYISLGVIEHFQEGPHAALREAHRVLKQGGLAFVSVPYLNSFRKTFVHPLRSSYFSLRRLMGRQNYFWEYRYTKAEVTKFLKDAGFEILDIAVDDYDPSDRRHHIGLFADFFFLRARGGEIWELNFMGRMLLALLRQFSPWVFCSGLLVVGRNTK